METTNSGKLSSRSVKSTSSKTALSSGNLVEAKIKKSKKKKKGRRNSGKVEADFQIHEIGAKSTSDDERGALEVEGVKAMGDRKDPDQSSGTTKLPSLVETASRQGGRDSPMPSVPSKLLYRPDPATVTSLAQRITNLNLKSQKPGPGRASNGRSKQGANGGASRPGKQTRTVTKDKSKSAPAVVKNIPLEGAFSNSTKNIPGNSQSGTYNESLRWDNALDDSEEERERIRLYKLNRRKRYLAAAQAKGLGWAVNYSITSFQISEDLGFDSLPRASGGGGGSGGVYTDYSTMRSLRPNQGMMGQGLVEC